jgi:L-threonylcarbamoyladenylate synthase
MHLPGVLAAVVEQLRRPGSLVVLPTETLYGFSARAMDAASVERVAALKGRQAAGFVALAASLEQVQRFLTPETPPAVLDWLRKTWPAPLSAILPVNGPLCWGRGSVESGWTAAFRVPAHAWMRQLAESLGEPVLSTSVNRTGAPPLRRVADIVEHFGDHVDLVVEDTALEQATAAIASTLLDATRWPPRVVRRGACPVGFEQAGEA